MYRCLILLALILPFGSSLKAEHITFFGEDLGIGETQRLSTRPNANSARDSFFELLSQNVLTETFESIPFTNPPNADPKEIVLSFGQDAATLSGPGLVINSPPPSAVNPLNGIASGVYPTSGDQAWLSLETFNMTFSTPQAAFGFYGVDIGDNQGQLLLDLLRPNASTLTLTIPHTVGGRPGGSLLFFGVIDLQNPFSEVRFRNTNPIFDGFAFDDMTIARASQVIPEPSSLTFLSIGISALIGCTCRHSRRVGETKSSFLSTLLPRSREARNM